MVRYTLQDLTSYISSHNADHYDVAEIELSMSDSLGTPIETVTRRHDLPAIDKDLLRRMYLEVQWWYGFIRFGNSTGHVAHLPIDYTCLNAHDTGPYSDRIVFNELVLPDSIVTRPATDDETVEFVKRCYRAGYMYDGIGFQKAPDVQRGLWMHFHDSMTGADSDYAVVGVSEDGLDVKVIRLGADSCVDDAETIHLWRHTYSVFKVSEKKRLSAEMADLGMSFNPETGTFMSSTPRAAFGEVYWYVSDRLSIRAEVDRRTPAHDSRYIAGNYFTSPESAGIFLAKVQDLLRDLRRASPDEQSSPSA